MKKVNPRKRPVTQADLNRAKEQASDRGVRLAIAMFLTVLKDDFDFDNEKLEYIWQRVEKLSEEVSERRISVNDLLSVLAEEYNVHLEGL